MDVCIWPDQSERFGSNQTAGCGNGEEVIEVRVVDVVSGVSDVAGIEDPAETDAVLWVYVIGLLVTD